MPVYNSEKTIERCLASIANTMYDNYEIIVVDDGSEDNSKAIVNKMLENDQHICLISQKNAGPSVARNTGLDRANGDIITFVDSDDYVDSNYLTQLAEVFSRTETEVCFFAFQRVNEEGEILSTHRLPAQSEDYYRTLIELSKSDVFGYTWVKAFRRTAIGKMRFKKDLNLLEDELFTCQVLNNQCKIYLLDEPIYNYVRTEGTLATKTHQDYSEINDLIWKEWNRLLQDCDYGKDFLIMKANKIADNCKWYALERKIEVLPFYKSIAESEYIKMVTSKDPIINQIREQKWKYVLMYHVYYKIKVTIAQWLNNIKRN